jgi:hypothetical protein
VRSHACGTLVCCAVPLLRVTAGVREHLLVAIANCRVSADPSKCIPFPLLNDTQLPTYIGGGSIRVVVRWSQPVGSFASDPVFVQVCLTVWSDSAKWANEPC